MRKFAGSCVYPRLAFPSKGLCNPCRSSGIGLRQAVKKTVGAYVEVLYELRKGGRGKWKLAAFYTAKSFPMDANQLGKALLGHVGLQPRLSRVSPDDS